MSAYLKLRGRSNSSLRGTVIFSVFTLIAEGFCFFIESMIIKEVYSVKIYVVGFPCFIGLIWAIYLCSLLFTKTIYVDNNEIRAIRFNKEIWNLKKEDIECCLYYEFKWWHVFIPLDSLASGDLMFRLKNGQISKHDCCLSCKQIKKICNMFDYRIEFIKG
jgi:hypothetical protein